MSKYSRGGCANCRKVHVKCDERKPACSRCVNRGFVCPGYQRPLRWSQKYEKAGTISSIILEGPVRDSCAETSVNSSPSSDFSDHVITHSGRLSPTIFEDPVLLVDCYSGVLSRVLSIFDGFSSPFRPAALSSWRRSPLLFSAFKFFAAVYQSNIKSNTLLRIALEEARLDVLGQLSSGLKTIGSSNATQKTEFLLVLAACGLSSSWYDLDDIGLEHYSAATNLLHIGADITPRNRQFFDEFLVYWWMMLSFTPGSDGKRIPKPPTIPLSAIGPRLPHPLTGVSPRSQMLLGMVARLVLDERKTILQNAMTASGWLCCSISNIDKARELESQLLALQIPSACASIDPGDEHTPLKDLLSIAEAYRMCGLLLLSHCYPDLIDMKLGLHPRNDASENDAETLDGRQSYLTSTALQVIQLLESNSMSSGTRTIEAILLLILSGELVRVPGSISSDSAPLGRNLTPGQTSDKLCSECSANATLRSVMVARSTVLTRFESIQAVLPFPTIPRMKSLVLETWKLNDDGMHVFWVDLLIKKEWQFLMI